MGLTSKHGTSIISITIIRKGTGEGGFIQCRMEFFSHSPMVVAYVYGILLTTDYATFNSCQMTGNQKKHIFQGLVGLDFGPILLL